MNNNIDNIISVVQKKDLRILKTEKAIKDAFIELLQHERYGKITINDIAKSAMINRNTFYLHYVDKDDLLDNILNDKFGYYIKSLSKHIFLYSQFKTENYKLLFKENLIESMNEIGKNKFFFEIFSNDDDFKNHIEKIADQSRYNLTKFYEKYDDEIKIKIEFVFNGSLGLFFKWLQSAGSFSSIKQIANLITENISNIIEEF